MTIHMRDHDGARVRCWTDEMSGYGQFNVVPLAQAVEVHEVLYKQDLGVRVIVHHCDGSDDCKCRPLTAGETLRDAL